MQGALVIGSKLDADVSAATCRLTFYGRLTALLDAADAAQLARLRVYKPKQRVREPLGQQNQKYSGYVASKRGKSCMSKRYASLFNSRLLTDPRDLAPALLLLLLFV